MHPSISAVIVNSVLPVALLAAASTLFPSSAASAYDEGRGLRRAPLPARQFVLGRRPFSSSSSWNTPIAADAVYTPVDWPAGRHYGVAWQSYSPAIHVSSRTDPVVSVDYPAGWGYAGGTLVIRMPLDADGADGTDGELLIVDGNTVHNFWKFRRRGPTQASAGSYGATNVFTGTGWGRRQPFLGAGIVATGSSQFAGLLVQAETDRGEIAHALQICIDASLARPGHAGEAIGGDGRNPNGIAQEGERLAIPPGTPMPDGLSKLGRQVFRAYQKYGAFVVDVAGGVTNLRAQANGYDRATIAELQRDLPAITCLLQRVR